MGILQFSNGILRRPVVVSNYFVHPAEPAVIKWVARIRAGCLATRAPIT